LGAYLSAVEGLRSFCSGANEDVESPYRRSGAGVGQGFGGVEALLTGLFAEFSGRLLPGEFEAFEQVGQEGDEELSELCGELRVYGRLLSVGRTVNE